MSEVFGSTEFISTVVGVFAGGAITLAIQLLIFWREEKRLDEERSDQKKSTAASAIFKIMRIQSNLTHLKNQFEVFEEFSKNNPESEPWQYATGFANLPPDIILHESERALLFFALDSDQFSRLLDVDEFHNATLAVSRRLSDHRQALVERVADLQELETEQGNRLGGALKQSDLNKLRPAMVETNALYESAKRLASESCAHATATLSETVATLRKLGLFNKQVELIEIKKNSK